MATRQLAKRQLTWLRSWPALDCIEVDRDGRPCTDPGSELRGVALNLLQRASM
jgi:tRNA A37 N6-isopentenylltransferase MiaA